MMVCHAPVLPSRDGARKFQDILGEIAMIRTAAFAAAMLFACTAGASAGYYDTHLLTKADVDLYLSVMDKAAAQAAVIHAKQKPCPKPLEFKKGHVPTAAEIQAITDAANCMAGAAASTSVDDAIANNNPHYEEVKDAIESLIRPNAHARDGVGPVESVASCGSAPGAWECAPPDWTPAMKAKFEEMDKISKQNRAFLEPYRPQIQRDETKVRRIGEEQPNPLAPPSGRQPGQYSPPAKPH
jgi:hypothetical protein